MMTGYDAVLASRWFTLDEFAQREDLKQVRGTLIHELDALREAYGQPIHPSRHPDGLVRTEGSVTSRHYVGGGRLGTAIDVFPEGDVASFLVAAIMNVSFRGIGVYGDTKILPPYQPGPMVHLDIRTGPVTLWVRVEGEYIYQSADPQLYYQKLGEILHS